VTSGTRPGRVVIGTLGLDQHEVGAMAISQLLVRHGYEVIYLGRFNTPERLAAVAGQEDADLVGVSVHSWEFTAYAGELLDRCRELGIGLVFGGSVLTEADRADLLARGADAVFGPYASEDAMLAEIGAIIDRVRSCVVAEVNAVAELARPLAGRVVLVTGAARGLGRAYAEELVRQGAAVVATDMDEAALKETAEILGNGVHPHVCDITDPQAPRALLDAALSRFGQLHGLMANAGLLRSGPILRLPDEDLQLLLDVHVTAAFRLLRVLGGYWRGEAKAAVAMLTRVAADEMARYQVTVNAVAPVARTRLTSWLGEGPAEAKGDSLAAEHVAPVVAWLLGPGARDVTGRVIEAGNGQVSVPAPWQPGTAFRLPPLMSPAQAQELLPRMLGSAGTPSGLLSADTALSEEAALPRPDPDPPRAS
jgi:methylmalonyl-CoA mutase cobalamin-binding domain/chain